MSLRDRVKGLIRSTAGVNAERWQRSTLDNRNVEVVLNSLLASPSFSSLHFPVQFVKLVRGCIESSCTCRLREMKVDTQPTADAAGKRFATLKDALVRGLPPLALAASEIALVADQNRSLSAAHEVGNWARDMGIHFGGASSFAKKGRILYNIVRIMHSERCLELGTAYGMSALFILAALKKYSCWVCSLCLDSFIIQGGFMNRLGGRGNFAPNGVPGAIRFPAGLLFAAVLVSPLAAVRDQPRQQLRYAMGESVAGYQSQSPDVRNGSQDTNAVAGGRESKGLDPATKEELNKGLEALRAGKPASAKKHLAWASQVMPTDPDVTFAWGMYYAEIKDWTNAASYWQRTLELYPKNSFALAGMGQLALRKGNLPEAIDYLGRAVEESRSSWQLEERLADAYYLHQENEQAEKHATHAIEVSEDRAALAQLVLAKVYLQRNDPQSALGILDTLVAHQSSGFRAEEAQRLVNSVRHNSGTNLPTVAEDLESAKATAFDPPSELVPPVKWMPPNVDERIPPVEQVVTCPMQEIQEESSRRVNEFVSAVNSITATETLEHEVIDARGLPSKRVSRTYTYVVSLQETRPGFYRVEEYRDGKTGQEVFPDHLAMFGLTSLVMIFHPAYRDEYEFSCEGLSRWNGRKAWQVHFRQRPDKPARVRGYRMGNQMFSLALRGRAWIAVDTFQILSLETDLVSPVPQIPLNAEHISIQYAPVQFHASKKELWLPENAELFVDFDVRRVHRSDHFSDYMLFSVDENEKVSAPPSPSEPDSTPREQPDPNSSSHPQ